MEVSPTIRVDTSARPSVGSMATGTAVVTSAGKVDFDSSPAGSTQQVPRISHRIRRVGAYQVEKGLAIRLELKYRGSPVTSSPIQSGLPNS